MPLRRVNFQSPIFPRREESAEEWANKSHVYDEPLAFGTMEMFGEIGPIATSGSGAQQEGPARTAEYVWSLGLTGQSLTWISQLDPEEAVLIQILLQSSKSQFVAREVFATLEYLAPSRSLHQGPSIRRIAKAATEVAGKVLQTAAHIPFADFAAGAISSLIPADNPETKWFLKKFDLPDSGFGVEWHLSRNLIEEVGSRIVGRLGLAFFDAPAQNEEEGPELGLNLAARFGLKLDSSHLGHHPWYDHSLVPPPGSEALLLHITPQRERVADRKPAVTTGKRASELRLPKAPVMVLPPQETQRAPEQVS